jgi:hypothetical protein
MVGLVEVVGCELGQGQKGVGPVAICPGFEECFARVGPRNYQGHGQAFEFDKIGKETVFEIGHGLCVRMAPIDRAAPTRNGTVQGLQLPMRRVFRRQGDCKNYQWYCHNTTKLATKSSNIPPMR